MIPIANFKKTPRHSSTNCTLSGQCAWQHWRSGRASLKSLRLFWLATSRSDFYERLWRRISTPTTAQTQRETLETWAGMFSTNCAVLSASWEQLRRKSCAMREKEDRGLGTARMFWGDGMTACTGSSTRSPSHSYRQLSPHSSTSVRPELIRRRSSWLHSQKPRWCTDRQNFPLGTRCIPPHSSWSSRKINAVLNLGESTSAQRLHCRRTRGVAQKRKSRGCGAGHRHVVGGDVMCPSGTVHRGLVVFRWASSARVHRPGGNDSASQWSGVRQQRQSPSHRWISAESQPSTSNRGYSRWGSEDRLTAWPVPSWPVD